MKVYYSKTGFIKCIISNVVYKTTEIYLGIHDSLDNYVDVSEQEYLQYLKSIEEE
jgi:hypothetical protein